MTTWNAEHYLRFGDARTRPAVELAARVPVSGPKTVIDLGCGPGNSTAVLRERWPEARVSGLDSSPEMIATARKRYPDDEWIVGRLDEWSPVSPFDVVFSNAALQWIPDHAALVRRLLGQAAEGGALAFQIPSGRYSRLRVMIDEIADDPAWRDRMEAPRGALTMEEPSLYYDALAPIARSVDIWETEYSHVMDGPPAIVEWISSTGMRPYLEALESDADRGRFVAALTGRVTEEFLPRADGRVLFPFRRLFVVATR